MGQLPNEQITIALKTWDSFSAKCKCDPSKHKPNFTPSLEIRTLLLTFILSSHNNK